MSWTPAPHLFGPDRKEPYKYEGHSPATSKKMPWLLRCKFCGLVYLKNEFTKRCIKAGCNHKDHPEYRKWRAETDNHGVVL